MRNSARMTRWRCVASDDGTYAVSTAILQLLGFELQDTEEILQVLKSRGGCCDCEILFNVAENSRLKAEYWRQRAADTGS